MKLKSIMIMLVALTIVCILSSVNAVLATSEDLQTETSTSLIEIKDKSLDTLKDYQDDYGDQAYGLAAFILRGVQVYSIPFGIVGIAVSAIYRYIIGVRKLDVSNRGFGAMIGIITAIVICQLLPLIFAVVVKGWRG